MQYLGYPKWRYHAVHEARQVRTPDEESRLTPSDEGWSDTYTYKRYPRAKYHPLHTGPEKHRIVKDEAEEKALGPGWYETPADFPGGLPEAGAAPVTTVLGVDPELAALLARKAQLEAQLLDTAEGEQRLAALSPGAAAQDEEAAPSVTSTEANPGDIVPTATRRPPRRRPDLETSRLRLDLYSRLAEELATIQPELGRSCTVASLKQRHPGFEIWNLLDETEMLDLMSGARFNPKAYAEGLVLRKFHLTSRETLKKDRKKLRKAGASASPPGGPSVPG